MSPDEQTIRATHATWIDAVNANDLPRLLALMADDCLFLNASQPPFGRDVFSPHFSAAHERNRIHCVSELQEVVVVGDLAYTRARDSLSVTPRAAGGASQETTQLAGDR